MDGVAEQAVHHPAPGVVVRGGGRAIELAAEDIEQLADHCGVIQRADGQGRPFQSGQGSQLRCVQRSGMRMLVKRAAEPVPYHVRVGPAHFLPA